MMVKSPLMGRLYRNAVASHKASDLNAAAQGYGAALELDPNYLPALNNLAATRAALGDPDTAVALYRDAIARHPGAAEPTGRRSGVHREGIGRGG